MAVGFGVDVGVRAAAGAGVLVDVGIAVGIKVGGDTGVGVEVGIVVGVGVAVRVEAAATVATSVAVGAEDDGVTVGTVVPPQAAKRTIHIAMMAASVVLLLVLQITLTTQASYEQSSCSSGLVRYDGNIDLACRQLYRQPGRTGIAPSGRPCHDAA